MGNLLFLTIIFFLSLNANAQLESQQGQVLNLNYNLLNETPKPFTLTFKNTGSLAASLPSPSFGTSFFKINVNRCVNVLPNKSCQISVSPARNTPVGTYVFSIGGIEINYQIINQDANGPVVATSIENLEVSPSSIGSVQFSMQETNKTINVSIKNIGTAQSSISMNSSGPLKILLNRCSNKLISPNKTCNIFFSIPNPGLDNTISYTLDFSISNQVKKSISFTSKGEVTQLQTLFSVSPSKMNALTGSGPSGGVFSGWRVVAAPINFNQQVTVKKITMRIGKYGNSSVKAKMIIAQNVLGEVGPILYESSNLIDTTLDIPDDVHLPISFNFTGAVLPPGNYYMFIAEELYPSSNETNPLKISYEAYNDISPVIFKSSLNNGVLFNQTFTTSGLFPPTIIEGF